MSLYKFLLIFINNKERLMFVFSFVFYLSLHLHDSADSANLQTCPNTWLADFWMALFKSVPQTTIQYVPRCQEGKKKPCHFYLSCHWWSTVHGSAEMDYWRISHIYRLLYEWMNEWMMHLYSALLCIAIHPKRFTIIWGGVSPQPPPGATCNTVNKNGGTNILCNLIVLFHL